MNTIIPKRIITKEDITVRMKAKNPKINKTETASGVNGRRFGHESHRKIQL